jgi:hypothetical protein
MFRVKVFVRAMDKPRFRATFIVSVRVTMRALVGLRVGLCIGVWLWVF